MVHDLLEAYVVVQIDRFAASVAICIEEKL